MTAVAIAISLLFGLALFCAAIVVGVSVRRGIAQGRAILSELAEIDALSGRTARTRKARRHAILSGLPAAA